MPSQRKTKPLMDRIESKIERRNGHWKWIGALSGRSAPQIRLGSPTFRRVSVRKVLAGLLDKSLPNGKELFPVCGEQGCVNPEHMAILTRAEFAKHLWAKGYITAYRGRFTDNEIREIRRLCTPTQPHKQDSKVRQDVMAEKHNVTKGMIGHIVTGRAYKRVEEKTNGTEQ